MTCTFASQTTPSKPPAEVEDDDQDDESSKHSVGNSDEGPGTDAGSDHDDSVPDQGQGASHNDDVVDDPKGCVSQYNIPEASEFERRGVPCIVSS